MRIGRNPPLPILRKALVSKAGSLSALLGFILLYGVQGLLPVLHPGSATQPSNERCKLDGMPGIVPGSVFARQQLLLTPIPLFLVNPQQRRWICLAPTTSARQGLPSPSGLVLEPLFRPLTLDTIICWEAHEH